ncbi:MAG: hypothetical protein QOE45_179 [Frankiaceae bacterium]|jgi:RNA polymerase sigma-70 factor (ECF subfamily)|nr:hypothetical protein [Frankiaceae bacterium]
MTVQPRDLGAVPEAPDTAEFEVFWRTFHDRLYRLALRYDAADADEIAQETLLRCYENWSRLDPDRNPWPWLTVVARNVAADHARARARRLDAENAALPPAADPVTPDDEVCARELRETVRTALRALPAGDRTVLSLYHFDDLPTAEIASLSGRTDNAVRQHLWRARRLLAVQLRRVTNGTTGALAPVVLWLRRAGRRLAPLGGQPVDSMIACVSIVTSVSVGLVAGGVPHGVQATAPPRGNGVVVREVPVAERPAHGVRRGHGGAVRAVPPADARRQPSARRAAQRPPTTTAGPLWVDMQGGPTNARDPNRVEVGTEETGGTGTSGDHFPGYVLICWAAGDPCPLDG